MDQRLSRPAQWRSAIYRAYRVAEEIGELRSRWIATLQQTRPFRSGMRLFGYPRWAAAA